MCVFVWPCYEPIPCAITQFLSSTGYASCRTLSIEFVIWIIWNSPKIVAIVQFSNILKSVLSDLLKVWGIQFCRSNTFWYWIYRAKQFMRLIHIHEHLYVYVMNMWFAYARERERGKKHWTNETAIINRWKFNIIQPFFVLLLKLTYTYRALKLHIQSNVQ